MAQLTPAHLKLIKAIARKAAEEYLAEQRKPKPESAEGQVIEQRPPTSKGRSSRRKRSL